MSAPGHERATSDRQTAEDLALLVRRLVSAVEKARGQTPLTRQARDYLARQGLAGNALRVGGNGLGETR